MKPFPWHRRYHAENLHIMRGSRLCDAEKVAYTVLTDLMFDRGGPLLDNPNVIAHDLGCSQRKWLVTRESLIKRGLLMVNNFGKLITEIAMREISGRRAQADDRSAEIAGWNPYPDEEVGPAVPAPSAPPSREKRAKTPVKNTAKTPAKTSWREALSPTESTKSLFVDTFDSRAIATPDSRLYTERESSAGAEAAAPAAPAPSPTVVPLKPRKRAATPPGQRRWPLLGLIDGGGDAPAVDGPPVVEAPPAAPTSAPPAESFRYVGDLPDDVRWAVEAYNAVARETREGGGRLGAVTGCGPERVKRLRKSMRMVEKTFGWGGVMEALRNSPAALGHFPNWMLNFDMLLKEPVITSLLEGRYVSQHLRGAAAQPKPDPRDWLMREGFEQAAARAGARG